MKLIAVSVAWIAGIYLGSLVFLPIYATLSALVLLAVMAFLCRRRAVLLWSALCLVAVLGGIACYQWRVNEPTLPERGFAEIQAEVERDPELDGGKATLRLTAHKIKGDSGWEDTSGKLLVHTYEYSTEYSTYSQGDLVRVAGELEPLSGIGSQDYRDYLERSGFRATMSSPQVESMESGWIGSARSRLSDSLARALPEPENSVAQALAVGIRSHIPDKDEEAQGTFSEDSLYDSFRRSGTSHLLAVSGLHVAILGMAVLSAAAWVFGRQRPTYLIIALLAVWLYALLTGMRPPAFRAAIMFSLFLAALWVGRPRSAVPSLVLAAAIMTGVAPLLLWDVSFQLSVTAVAGVMVLGPSLVGTWEAASPVRGWMGRGFHHAGQVMMLSLAATIAVYPLIVYYFGSIPLVGASATFCALPALPPAIVTALITAVLGLFAPTLATATGCVAWLFLRYLIEVVQSFAALPFASHDVGQASGAVVWGCYAVLIAFVSRRRWRPVVAGLGRWVGAGLARAPGILHHPPKKWVMVSIGVAAVLVWLAVLSMPDNNLEVRFLDVGQGDSVLVRTPSGVQVLVDGGPDQDSVCLELGESLPFHDRDLDLVILTHPDSDHVGGLVEVLRRYEVGRVLEAGVDSSNTAYQEWLSLVDQKGIERTMAVAGQRIDLGDGVTMQVLHPPEELMKDTESDVNNNSVVIRLLWKEVSFLLTGDIYEEAEWDILYRGHVLDTTVLKVAHHGSATSSCAHFVAAADPQAAVICVGTDNTFGHPDDETLARLGSIPVYRTDEDGTITFTTDGERLWVETER